MNSEILAEAFYSAGEDVHLITWTKKNGDKVFPFPVIRNPNVTTLMREHRWANIIFENNPSLRLSWPNMLFNKPSVVAIRTWIRRMDGSIGFQDKLKKYWLKRAVGVIAVSDAVREKSWPKATVIGNPYRADLFKINPDVMRSYDFVFLGRLVSDKGADMAIKALELLKGKKQIPCNAILTIIGDGPDRKTLEKMAVELGLKANVVFRGNLTGASLVNCLNAHKYLIVPSIWDEPFGNIVLEGIACGCIPIVSDSGGLPEAVGSAGLTFERGNIRSLVEAIKMIINNTGLRDKLREAAPRHLSNHTTIVVAKKYLQVIERCCGL